MTHPPSAVVVIDDDDQVRRALVRILRVHGCATCDFASAAGYLAARPAAACLVLDIDLGGTSGIEFYRQLVAAGEAPPVVFITGKPSPVVEQAARALGAIEFFCKPIDGPALLAAVRRA